MSVNNLQQTMMNSRAPSSAPARDPLATPGRRCGVCRQTGHDRRSCPVLQGASQQGASPPAPPTRQQVQASAPPQENHNLSMLDTALDNRAKREMVEAMQDYMANWKEFERSPRNLEVSPEETLLGKRILHHSHIVNKKMHKLYEQLKKRENVVQTLRIAINDLSHNSLKGIYKSLREDYIRQLEVLESNKYIHKMTKMTFELTYQRWTNLLTEWRNRSSSLKDVLLSMSKQTERADVCIPADDCPICMEPLGNTGKTVLSCGHTLCTSCFIKQIVVAHDQKKSENCGCPVCRRKYAGGSAPRTPQQT